MVSFVNELLILYQKKGQIFSYFREKRLLLNKSLKLYYLYTQGNSRKSYKKVISNSKGLNI